MATISKSYLMWIGKEHYPTIADYVKEAETQGVSKRLPNGHFAAKLANPEEKAVVFLAHDEGVYTDCESCHGSGGGVTFTTDACTGCCEVLAEMMAAGVGGSTDEQDLAGTINGNFGKDFSITYQQFNVILHQPKKFVASSHEITTREMCPTCGGTGRIPKGQIFGMFVPTAVEYILNAGDTDLLKDEVEKRGIKTVTTTMLAKEKPRGCGRRKGGAYYMVSTSEKTDVDVTEVLAEMQADGRLKTGDVEISGTFARFLEPIQISTKRFRGLKTWALDPRAEDEAVMAMEAME